MVRGTSCNRASPLPSGDDPAMTWGPLRAERTSPILWLQLKRIIRRQQSYIAIAVAIYAGLWAADRPSDLATTIIYTLPLCNLIALVNEQLGFLSAMRPPLQSWAIYLALVLFIAVVGVAVVKCDPIPTPQVSRPDTLAISTIRMEAAVHGNPDRRCVDRALSPYARAPGDEKPRTSRSCRTGGSSSGLARKKTPADA